MENFCTNGKLEHKNGYDVCRNVDQRGELRYDLTKIFPEKFTAGHYHINSEPEIYEVQSGQAQFLIQNHNAQETYLIEVKTKEKVIIVPGFSMRTINPSSKTDLIISNWVNNNVKNDYNAFKTVPAPVKLKPKPLPIELENLDFLINPSKYSHLLTVNNLYEKI